MNERSVGSSGTTTSSRCSLSTTAVPSPARRARCCVAKASTRRSSPTGVAPREADHLARELIDTTARVEGIERDQLTLHADRGTPMTSKTVAQLLADLGVTRSHSRPHVSNDNPYPEAQFKTLKNTPRFPNRFTSLTHARTFVDEFFEHYNQHHRHSGIGHHTAIRAHRQADPDHAYATQPHRFRRPPTAPRVPEITWINPPEPNLSHSA